MFSKRFCRVSPRETIPEADVSCSVHVDSVEVRLALVSLQDNRSFKRPSKLIFEAFLSLFKISLTVIHGVQNFNEFA